MTSVITANNPAGRDNRAPAPELRSDGTNFPYRMFFNGGAEIVDADTLAECIECLIPTYLDMSDEERFEARVDYAGSIRQQLRAEILVNVGSEEIEDWEWHLISGAYEESHPNMVDPFGWGEGSIERLGEVDSNIVDVWSCRVPLVLVETSYAPFSEIVAPLSSEGDYLFVSNIVWLRPADELNFLKSLSLTNMIRFGYPREAALANG